jgi:four helix bundle protein
MIGMSYQDLKIWQKSIDLVDAIYAITLSFPKEEIYGLTSQMRRSAISIASNIAEGSQRTTKKDFANFLSTSKGSLAELETQIIISSRRKYCDEKLRNELLQKTDELHRMIYSFHASLLS